MASRGATALTSDGSDFSYRQTVASHYVQAAWCRTWLRRTLVLQLVLSCLVSALLFYSERMQELGLEAFVPAASSMAALSGFGAAFQTRSGAAAYVTATLNMLASVLAAVFAHQGVDKTDITDLTTGVGLTINGLVTTYFLGALANAFYAGRSRKRQ